MSEEGNSPDATSPPTEGRTPKKRPSESDASESGQPQPPASSDVTEPQASDQETDSLNTPFTSPSPTRTREPRDVTPPNTNMSEAQPEPDAARFTFSADEGASFACSLDGGAFTTCDSPSVYSDLPPGWHAFAVKAVDAAGNADPSPAESSVARQEPSRDGSVTISAERSCIEYIGVLPLGSWRGRPGFQRTPE